jgi:hypothetical protein
MFRKSLSLYLFVGLLCSTALAPAQCTRCGPLLSMRPSALNFGSVSVGKRSTALRISVRQLGAIPASISGITATAGFTQTNTCGKSLPHGASCVISVVFAPTAVKSYAGQLTVLYNGGKAVATLAGQGTK